MSRVPDASKRRRWQRLLREQHESGDSIALFCAQRKIPVHQFYWWQRQLRSQSVSGQPPVTSSTTFVPVRLPLVGVAPIEIVHRHGHIIRVHDVTSLRCVLELLASDAANAEV